MGCFVDDWVVCVRFDYVDGFFGYFFFKFVGLYGRGCIVGVDFVDWFGWGWFFVV